MPSRLTAAVTTTRRITAFALALGALTLVPLSAANAAAPAAPAQSCWYNVDNDTMGCFDAALDPQQQIELATGTEVVAVPTGTARTSAEASSTAALSSVAAPESFLLATGHDTIAYGTPSFTYFTQNPAICNGVDHPYLNLGTWSNRFESFQTYNGCVGYLFDSINYGGAELGPVTASTNLGTFNNRAESMAIE